MIEISTIETPIGIIEITADTNFVRSIQFIKEEKAVFLNCENDIINQTKNELTEYFNGDRTLFTLPLTFATSPFYKKVLMEVQKIKYGQTASYGLIANMVGKKGASRAVGKANSKNPIVIVVPCHRIITYNGAIGGYSAGIDKKSYLLKHEGAVFDSK